MSVWSIVAAGFRKIASAWADLPLRTKGPVVVAIPVAALLAASVGFGFALFADHQSEICLEQVTVLVSAIQDRLSQLDNDGCSSQPLDARFRSLMVLLRNQPSQLQRLLRIEETCRSLGWKPTPGQARALRMQLRAWRNEEQDQLLARTARLRTRALAAIAVDAVVGLAGGLLAVVLFISAMARVSRLQLNAARLEQRLPLLPWRGGRDELGSLHAALEKSSASLRRTEEERDRFFILSLDMLCVTSLDGSFHRVNPAFTATLGFLESALVGSNLLDFVHPEDRETTAGQFQQLACGVPIAYLQNRFRCADGSYKWLAWSMAPFLPEGLAFGVARDRTKQVSDELALRESRDRLAAMLESTTDAFFAVDCDWRLTCVNTLAERLWNRTRAELLGNRLWDVFPEAIGGPFYQLYHEVMRTGEPGHIEEFYPPFQRWFEVHVYPSPEGLSVYFRDITERRQAEAQMKRALKDNEVLLREVHHRVKNNLQVICSLLRLQARYTQDDSLLQVLRDCRERVYAMALLHDQLHRARDLSSVDLSEYLKNVASSLFCSYGVDSARIELRLHLQNITVAFDTAIPCGLIVHELVSNSLRHAFPDGAGGRVSLNLRARTGGRVELTIADDGIGCHECTGGTSGKSLGLRLVTLLAEQMEAGVERSTTEGTQYRIRFQVKNQVESNPK
jgi:PAS domain S-box-containing protein